MAILTSGALLTQGKLPFLSLANSWRTGGFEGAFHMQTNRSGAHSLLLPPISSIRLSYSRPICPCPNHSRVRYQTTRDHPYAPGSWNHSNCPVLNPLYPASPIPSHENHDKGSCPPLPSSLCLLTHMLLPHYGPTWCRASRPLGTVREKLSFQRWWSPDLLTPPHLRNNKTHTYNIGSEYLHFFAARGTLTIFLLNPLPWLISV